MLCEKGRKIRRLQILSGKVPALFYPGCGVNALSVLQDFANSTYCRKYCRPDKRSASGSFVFAISLKGRESGPFFYLVEINGTVLPGIMVSGSLPSQRSAVVRATSPGFSRRASPRRRIASASAALFKRIVSASAAPLTRIVSASALAAAEFYCLLLPGPELPLFAPGLFSVSRFCLRVGNGDFCFHSVFNRLFISVRKINIFNLDPVNYHWPNNGFAHGILQILNQFCTILYGADGGILSENVLQLSRQLTDDQTKLLMLQWCCRWYKPRLLLKV